MKKRTELKKAVGKLISVIQQEWGYELGEPYAELSENVMGLAHSLLQASSAEKIETLLCGMTIRQYLGDIWVQTHPRVKPALFLVEKEVLKEKTKKEKN